MPIAKAERRASSFSSLKCLCLIHEVTYPTQHNTTQHNTTQHNTPHHTTLANALLIDPTGTRKRGLSLFKRDGVTWEIVQLHDNDEHTVNNAKRTDGSGAGSSSLSSVSSSAALLGAGKELEEEDETLANERKKRQDEDEEREILFFRIWEREKELKEMRRRMQELEKWLKESKEGKEEEYNQWKHNVIM